MCDEEPHYGQNPINIQGSMGGGVDQQCLALSSFHPSDI